MTPEDLGAQCSKCPFAKNGKSNPKFVLGSFPVKEAAAVLIGDGPSSSEEEMRKPFCGPTGEQLNKALEQVGLPREKLVVVNATCCKPPSNSSLDALLKAAACCLPAMNSQLKPYSTLFKFLMGTAAATSILGKLKKGGVEAARGFVREKEKAIVSYHPTYAFFHNPYARGTFEVDLQRFARMVRGHLEIGPDVDPNPRSADLAHLAESCEVLAFDIETTPAAGDEKGTTGKDPTRARLKSIGFGTTDRGLSVMWEDCGEEWIEQIKKVFLNEKITKVSWNGTWFDLPVLERYGFQIVNHIDGRDVRRALSAISPLSLRFSTSLYTDFSPWKEAEAADEDEVK